jgi:hypothetical protein
MSRSLPLVVLSALVALLVAFLVLSLRGGGEGAAGSVSSNSSRSQGNDLAYGWAVGTAYTWDVELDVTAGPVGSARPTQGMGLSSELTLHVLGAQDGGWWLEARLGKLERLQMAADGRELFALDGSMGETLSAFPVGLLVDEHGRIQDRLVSPGMPEFVATLLPALVDELLVELGSGSEWSHSEAGFLGEGVVASRVLAWEGEAVSLQRSRSAYDELTSPPSGEPTASVEGGFVARLSSGGVLVELSGSEHASQAVEGGWEWSMSLSALLRDAQQQPVGLDRLAALRAPNPLQVSRELDELRMRVGDMTPESFLADLASLAGPGQLPNHNQWLYQAGGLLELHPELCAQLAASIAQQDGLSESARLLGVDLLAGVGHAEAQQGLRDVLGDPNLEAGRYRTRLLQSGALLQRYEPETLAVYEDLALGLNDSDGRAAASFMTGHLASLAAASGDADASGRVVEGLGERLHAAAEPAEQELLLTALGNAGTEQVEELVTPYLESEEPWVRGRAVRALRNVEGDSAQDRIWDALSDAAPEVRGQALRALGSRNWSAADLASLGELVDGGSFGPGEVPRLLDIAQSSGASAQQDLLVSLYGVEGLSGSDRERILSSLPRDALAPSGG